MTRVKICGVNSAAAFDAVVQAGADYLGLNFFPQSPRFVTLAQAAALSARLEGGPSHVGLFVDPGDAQIEAVLADVKLDILQIYADAPRASAIRQKFGLPVWQAIGVAAKSDLPISMNGLDGFLIEARPPPGSTRPGGNAVAMDWSLLAGWKAPGFFLLGGGLTPDNVTAVIAQTGVPGVDVSSGVEAALGIKSPELIKSFVARVKR